MPGPLISPHVTQRLIIGSAYADEASLTSRGGRVYHPRHCRERGRCLRAAPRCCARRRRSLPVQQSPPCGGRV